MTKRLTVLVLISLPSTVSIAQAVINSGGNEWGMAVCPRFLATLQQDRIFDMTPDQFCRYDFMRRHSGAYYKPLDWKPVKGDPVALTMKIYDVTAYTSPWPRLAKIRADFLAYAEEQNKHHDLAVEIAPITLGGWTETGTPAPIHAYVLRSRGGYCASADVSGERTIESTVGRTLIAFFQDYNLNKPIPDPNRTVFYQQSYPMVIDGRYYIANLDTRWLYRRSYLKKWYYSGDLDSPSYMGFGQVIRASGTPICRYVIQKNS